MTPVVAAIGTTHPYAAAGLLRRAGHDPCAGARPVAIVAGVSAQDAARVLARTELDPATIAAQFDALAGRDVGASASVRCRAPRRCAPVAERLRAVARVPVICDPVIAASGGDRLVDDATVTALRDAAVPALHADHAQSRRGRAADRMRDRRARGDARRAPGAARLGTRAVLLKGGHLAGDPLDLFADGSRTVELRAPRLPARATRAPARCSPSRSRRAARSATRCSMRSCRPRAFVRERIVDGVDVRRNAPRLLTPRGAREAPPRKTRVMSGMRPTGRLHLGHLVGALTNWAELSRTADAYFEIADLHAYTTQFQHPDEIRAAREDMVRDWLAAGVDPQRSTIYLQSAIPEISELHVLLSMIAPVSWLERTPTYKEQIEALGNEIATYGFLGYPLLQLCDIAIFRGEKVPVGRDQVAHLELGREIVRRFNSHVRRDAGRAASDC